MNDIKDLALDPMTQCKVENVDYFGFEVDIAT